MNQLLEIDAYQSHVMWVTSRRKIPSKLQRYRQQELELEIKSNDKSWLGDNNILHLEIFDKYCIATFADLRDIAMDETNSCSPIETNVINHVMGLLKWTQTKLTIS